MKKALFNGLFRRLLGAGIHPIAAGEIAAANYPHRDTAPMRPPKVSTREVHRVTEQFLGSGEGSPNALFYLIWGCSPAEYFGSNEPNPTRPAGSPRGPMPGSHTADPQSPSAEVRPGVNVVGVDEPVPVESDDYREVLYSSASWSRADLDAVRSELADRGVTYLMEEGHLVVDKSVEEIVDRVLDDLDLW